VVTHPATFALIFNKDKIFKSALQVTSKKEVKLVQKSESDQKDDIYIINLYLKQSLLKNRFVKFGIYFRQLAAVMMKSC